MSETKWTTEQQKVIDERDKSLLVSAAAGSGKTAVLVERIISLICSKVHPYDIDEILVVTFTKAAAAEMKARIYESLLKKSEEDPDNKHLIKQLTLVHSAEITTIDSFAGHIARSNFEAAGIDPTYRIMDEGEKKLLIRDTWEEVLEQEYAEGRQSFLNLSDKYGADSKPERLWSDVLMKIYDQAQAAPWPDDYLDSIMRIYEYDDAENLLKSDLFHEIYETAGNELADSITMEEELLAEAKVLNTDEKNNPYVALFGDDLNYLNTLKVKLEKLNTDPSSALYDELKDDLNNHKWRAKPRKKSTDTAEDIDFSDRVARVRDGIKNLITSKQSKSLAKQFFYISAEDIIEEIRLMKPYAEEMTGLVMKFSQAYEEKKRAKNIMEFADVEHAALRALIDPETRERTKTAESLSRQYREVMVDEYQDSNMLQEELLSAVTRNGDNYFMVGDIKQSIYSFRQARPEILAEKAERYQSDGDDRHMLINLDMNFRSRQSVIDTTNIIFSSVMHSDLGGVEYDISASLKKGADFPDDTAHETDTEVMLVPGDGENTPDDDMDKVQREADGIARRITELHRTMKVYDRKNKCMRPIRYSDIVILYRKLSGVSDKVREVLEGFGIPVHVQSAGGYFDTVEISTVMSSLSLINNPLMDIALVSVLHSPMTGLSNEAMLNIRAAYEDRNITFSQAFFKNLEEREADLTDEEWEKCIRFNEALTSLREAAHYTPIHKLIIMILDRTGYMSYVRTLPGGDRREANINKLISFAVSFEKTSYHGIFQFIRYIDRLKKNEVNTGEADTTSENDDSVRIMTIHKSKGLQFPVVFVAGLNNSMNLVSRNDLVINDRYGFGFSIFDAVRRIKQDSFIKNVLSLFDRKKEIGESLRIYYVALTRAEEKLILTAVYDSKKMDALDEAGEIPKGGKLAFSDRLNAGSFMEMALPVLRGAGIRPEKLTAEGETVKEAAKEARRTVDKAEIIKQMDAEPDETAQMILQRLSYKYPYENRNRYKSKYSVSEIKHRAMEEEMLIEAEPLIAEPQTDQEPREYHIPAFMGGHKSVNLATERGTAMHRFMEKLDFQMTPLADSYDEQLKRELSRNFLTVDQAKLLNESRLKRFLSSDLAARMQQADKKKKLYREQAFVMGDAPEYFLDGHYDGPALPVQDQAIVQGIIDAFFIEDDRIILLDYKTDNVKDENVLIRRYATQLKLYQTALERSFGLNTAEKILYSFALSKEIRLSD